MAVVEKEENNEKERRIEVSLEVKTTKGTIVCHIQLFGEKTVTVGKHEIPLEDFCGMAAHFLGGGFFGWGQGQDTPECVNNTLSFLFGLYKKEESRKWIRKSEEELRREEKG